MLTSILIGLLGVGIVVLIHEFGHLLCARWVGVDVETFSIGWGKRLWSFMYKGTEYRISLLPIGGYVKLKGEEEIMDAYTKRAKRIEPVANGFYDVTPWRRMIIAIGGPLFNVISAFIIFMLISVVGYNISTYGNRIVLNSELGTGATFAADKAGLKSGDIITAVNGVETDYFFQIRNQVIDGSGQQITLEINRNDEQLTLYADGTVDSDVGVAVLGVYPWVEPIVESVAIGEEAEIAGVIAGDRIISVNGQTIEHATEFNYALGQNSIAMITVLRGTTERTFRVPVGENDEGVASVGILFPVLQTRISAKNIGQATSEGLQEIKRVFTLTVRGLSALFSGAQVNNIIAGPIQLTSMIGDVTKSGIEGGVWSVVRLFFNFLAVVSVALCFMNLLPIPIVDGGRILLYFVEGITRSAISARAIIRYQQIGGVFVLLLILLSLFSDFLFLFN